MTKQETAEILTLKNADLSLLSIADLKVSINKKFIKIDKINEDLEIARVNAKSKEHDLTIQVGLHLIELRQRIENGEAGDEAALTWWEWYAANFPSGRTRRHAERCMEAARAANPIAHRQAEKEAQRERMAKLRQEATQRGVDAVFGSSEPQERNHNLTATTHNENVRRSSNGGETKNNNRPIYQLVDRPDPDIDHSKIERIMDIARTCNMATLECLAIEFKDFYTSL